MHSMRSKYPFPESNLFVHRFIPDNQYQRFKLIHSDSANVSLTSIYSHFTNTLKFGILHCLQSTTSVLLQTRTIHRALLRSPHTASYVRCGTVPKRLLLVFPPPDGLDQNVLRFSASRSMDSWPRNRDNL